MRGIVFKPPTPNIDWHTQIKQVGIAEKFGKHLCELRTERGFTQKQMAKKLQVSDSTYANWEQGRREPPLYHIILISKILDVDMNTLFEFELKG